jgi:hypothetical protein
MSATLGHRHILDIMSASQHHQMFPNGCTNKLCFQETNRDDFDHEYLKKFTPRAFDEFSYIPSFGNSRGTLISWKGIKF